MDSTFRRSLRFGISFLMFLGDSVLRRIRRLLGLRIPGTCVFINYHAVTDGTRDRFASQMAALLRIAVPSSLSEITRQKLVDGVHYVVVTFDDAFCSFSTLALPILSEQCIPVLLFVPTGYLGRESAWFDYGGDNAVGEQVVSLSELTALARNPHVEFGSHSVTHRNLIQLTADEVCNELSNSKAALEDLLEREVNSISFPYGSFSERELDLARKKGYQFCFSVVPQLHSSRIPEGLIGRVSVQPSDWFIEFRLKLIGAYRWLEWASKWKRKVKAIFTRQTRIKNHK